MLLRPNPYTTNRLTQIGPETSQLVLHARWHFRAFYLADLARQGRKPASLRRKLTAIGRAHEAAGHPSRATMREALVSETLKGIRRTMGVAQTGKEAVLTRDLRKLIRHLPENLLGLRDRTLLLVGFAGGLRRSELCALDVTDLSETEDGLILDLRKSKTDQEAEGTKIGIPYGSSPETCPVRTYRSWLGQSGIRVLDSPPFCQQQLGLNPAIKVSGRAHARR